MIRVLNIAQFIPVEGLRPDNNISLKIYFDLKQRYGIDSEFVKPVERVPGFLQYYRKSSKITGEIFSRTDYIDKDHNIKVHFYKGTYPLINRFPFNTDFLLPFQYNCYNSFLEDLVKTYNPDIIHAHSIHPDGYYAYRLAKKLSIPYILTVRGSFTLDYHSRRYGDILRHASAITTPAFNLWNNLSKEYKVELLPHGIGDGWFIEKRKIFSDESLRLVTVSRLLEMKNIQLVVRAMARLAGEGFIITYDIIGDGEYRNKLEALVKELGLDQSVRFHGYQDPDYIRKVYENTDIFVMLSYPETFGLSYFEAAAQGLYIIGVKDTGAYGHLDDKDGSFINVSEVELVEALKNLTSREIKLKTSRLKSKILNFRNSEIIARYHSLISELV